MASLPAGQAAKASFSRREIENELQNCQDVPIWSQGVKMQASRVKPGATGAHDRRT